MYGRFHVKANTIKKKGRQFHVKAMKDTKKGNSLIHKVEEIKKKR